MDCAKVGDRVRIHYSLLPAKRAPSEKPLGGKELEFTVGSRDVFRGLSLGVVGMAPGDEKRLTLQPHEAYGPVQPKLIRQIPRARFPQHIALQVGKRLTAFVTASGSRKPVRVVEVNAESVTVDGNHPLAGKVIDVDVRMISVKSLSSASRGKPQLAGKREPSRRGKKSQ